MNIFDQFVSTIPDIALRTQQSFSETELKILAVALSDPTVKKYFQSLAANNIRSFAELPLSTMAEEGSLVNMLKQAYLKGGLSMLQTLLQIEAPKPPSAPVQQEPNSPI